VRGFRRLNGAGFAFRLVVLAVLAAGLGALGRGDVRAQEPAVPQPTPAVPVAPQPAEPLRVVVFGDSQAQGIAGGLQRLLLNDPRFKVLNRTHPGAALVHGRNEWMGPIERFVARESADIAIVMFGANDRLDMREVERGPYLHFRSDPWAEVYTRRTDEVLSALAKAKLKIIWCGNPIARSPTYSADMSYINGIYDEAVARAGATFFPLWAVIADPAGNYAAYGKDRNGVNQRLRGDDGIHFTAAGYEVIAEKLVNLLPSMQPKPP